MLDAAMDELGLCGCGEADAVLVMLLGLLEERGTPYDAALTKDVRAWAQGPWRPCCGTCRTPIVVDKMPDRPCAVCGDEWGGSEAGQREAWYRASLVPSTAGRTLGLYLLDQLDLIEHGGSVGGAWLTDKGKAFLARYRSFVVRDELVQAAP